jgi:hypothetical protein
MSAKKESPMPISAFSLFEKSVEIVRRNILIFGLLYILPFILSARSFTNEDAHHNGSGITWNSLWPSLDDWLVISILIAVSLFAAIIFIFVQVMTTVAQFEGTRVQIVKLSAVWAKSLKFFWRMIGLYILSILMILGGLILLIVPGVIMIRRLFLSPYVLLDKDVGIREAMRRSAKISKPYSSSVYAVIGVIILISLLGIIPFAGFVLSFVFGMLYSIAPALRYQEIKKLS